VEHEYNKEAVVPSPWRLVFRLLIIIFSVEAVIMFFLPTLIPEEHALKKGLLPLDEPLNQEITGPGGGPDR